MMTMRHLYITLGVLLLSIAANAEPIYHESETRPVTVYIADWVGIWFEAESPGTPEQGFYIDVEAGLEPGERTAAGDSKVLYTKHNCNAHVTGLLIKPTDKAGNPAPGTWTWRFRDPAHPSRIIGQAYNLTGTTTNGIQDPQMRLNIDVRGDINTPAGLYDQGGKMYIFIDAGLLPPV